jgi:hypothetical protein
MAGHVRYKVLLDANDGDPDAVGMSACLGMLDSMQRIFFCTVDTVIGTLKGVL